MNNKNTLVEILMSDAEYWILAKRNYVSNGLSETTLPDQIIFALINHEKIKLRSEIKLIDLEDLERRNLVCVHINDLYPPFQQGITLWDVHTAFPVKNNVREIFDECLKLKSHDIYEYKKIIDKLS